MKHMLIRHQLFVTPVGVLLSAFSSAWWLIIAIPALALALGYFYHRSKTNRQLDEIAELKSALLQKDELLAYARQKEQIARFVEAQAKTKESTLLTQISRDIRTPMTTVMGMAALLAATALTDEQHEYVTGILLSGESLLVQINEIVLQNISACSEVQASKEPGVNTSRESQSGNKQKLCSDFAKQYPLRILIAEDNLMNQKIVGKIFNKLGYDPKITNNGKEVLEEVSDTRYDLIMMDVQMPEMDGFEATRMIRVCLNHQPVIIAMTANTMQGDREDCLRAGMDDYICKPVNLEQLTGLLEKWAIHSHTKA